MCAESLAVFMCLCVYECECVYICVKKKKCQRMFRFACIQSCYFYPELLSCKDVAFSINMYVTGEI